MIRSIGVASIKIVFVQELSHALSKNAHEFWAKQMKNRLAAIGKSKLIHSNSINR